MGWSDIRNCTQRVDTQFTHFSFYVSPEAMYEQVIDVQAGL